MKKIFIAVMSFIAFIAGITAAYSWALFVIKFLVDVLHYDLPFWSSLFSNVITWIIVEILAVILLIITGGLAAVSINSKKKGR